MSNKLVSSSDGWHIVMEKEFRGTQRETGFGTRDIEYANAVASTYHGRCRNCAFLIKHSMWCREYKDSIANIEKCAIAKRG